MTTDPINAARDERTVKPPPLVSLTLCGMPTSTPTTLPSRPPANPICQLFHAARPKPQTGHSLGCCHQENAVRPKTALPYPATPPVLCPRPVRPRALRCAGRRATPLCRARSLCKNQICPSGGIRGDDDDDLELWYDYLGILSPPQNDHPQIPG